ncbi:MAG: hypothetical protein JW920_04735 [Deltaproteobacteria bacterium]|nr:hypothetical protein [Deltaproteobacteria bacterium]
MEETVSNKEIISKIDDILESNSNLGFLKELDPQKLELMLLIRQKAINSGS